MTGERELRAAGPPGRTRRSPPPRSGRLMGFAAVLDGRVEVDVERHLVGVRPARPRSCPSTCRARLPTWTVSPVSSRTSRAAAASGCSLRTAEAAGDVPEPAPGLVRAAHQQQPPVARHERARARLGVQPVAGVARRARDRWRRGEGSPAVGAEPHGSPSPGGISHSGRGGRASPATVACAVPGVDDRSGPQRQEPDGDPEEERVVRALDLVGDAERPGRIEQGARVVREARLGFDPHAAGEDDEERQRAAGERERAAELAVRELPETREDEGREQRRSTATAAARRRLMP